MQFIIQDSMTWLALQNNCNPFILALQNRNKPFYTCGIIPFDHIITGLENIDKSIPTFFYGGTMLPVLAKGLNFNSQIFYEDSWWNPKTWSENRIDMLNQSVEITTIGNLKTNWINEPTFIKPIAVKEFSGMVIEGADKDWWMQEYSDIKNDLEICCSPIHNIEREWRFWLIDGKVIAGSQYKQNGCLSIKSPIPNKVWYTAIEKADEWLPCSTVVMDIALLNNGEYKIVEFNSIHSSGFYNANIYAIIEAIEQLYTR